MRRRPSLMGRTAEFTGGCTDATIATLGVLTAVPTTQVRPTTTVLPITTVLAPTTTVLRLTMGGTGTIERPSILCADIEDERPEGVCRCGWQRVTAAPCAGGSDLVAHEGHCLGQRRS